MIFARKVSCRELNVLNSALTDRSLPSYVRTRLAIIKLSTQGLSVPEISQELNLNPITIRKWLSVFNEQGLPPLLARKRGGGPKPKFTSAYRDTILWIANMNPRDLGLPYDKWSLRKLRAHLEEYGLAPGISCERLRQILEAAGVSFLR
ncbi:MAG: helix-turn-helix domain-containing protein [Bacillota bacterium]